MMDSREYIKLIQRKAELEKALKILQTYNEDDVLRELGEINYQLFPTEKAND